MLSKPIHPTLQGTTHLSKFHQDIELYNVTWLKKNIS